MFLLSVSENADSIAAPEVRELLKNGEIKKKELGETPLYWTNNNKQLQKIAFLNYLIKLLFSCLNKVRYIIIIVQNSPNFLYFILHYFIKVYYPY